MSNPAQPTPAPEELAEIPVDVQALLTPKEDIEAILADLRAIDAQLFGEGAAEGARETIANTLSEKYGIPREVLLGLLVRLEEKLEKIENLQKVLFHVFSVATAIITGGRPRENEGPLLRELTTEDESLGYDFRAEVFSSIENVYDGFLSSGAGLNVKNEHYPINKSALELALRTDLKEKGVETVTQRYLSPFEIPYLRLFALLLEAVRKGKPKIEAKKKAPVVTHTGITLRAALLSVLAASALGTTIGWSVAYMGGSRPLPPAFNGTPIHFPCFAHLDHLGEAVIDYPVPDLQDMLSRRDAEKINKGNGVALHSYDRGEWGRVLARKGYGTILFPQNRETAQNPRLASIPMYAGESIVPKGKLLPGAYFTVEERSWVFKTGEEDGEGGLVSYKIEVNGGVQLNPCDGLDLQPTQDQAAWAMQQGILRLNVSD